MPKQIGTAAPTSNSSVVSRYGRLAKQFVDKTFRHAFMSRSVRGFIAAQIKALRGERSQTEFGRHIGKPQSVVSRLEDEGYGNVNVSTLLDIAEKLDVALIVRFVDYPTFIKSTKDYSPTALVPASYTPGAMEDFIQDESSPSPVIWDKQQPPNPRRALARFGNGSKTWRVIEEPVLQNAHG